MAQILPSQLPAAPTVNSTAALIVDSGSIVEKATPAQIVNAAAPVASEAEALAGTDNVKRMTSLRTRQALGELVSDKAQADAIGIAGDAENMGTFTSPLIDDNTTAKAALESIGTNLAGDAGAERVGIKVPFTGSVRRVISTKMEDGGVSIKDFGAKFDGTTDDTAAWLSAIDSGEVLNIPYGTSLVSEPLTLGNGAIIRGMGIEKSIILVHDDIEVFNSSNATASTAVFGVEMRDFFINKTVTGPTTKYDIHLYNPNVCQFHNVRVKSGHDDASYSDTNVGGFFLDRPPGSTTTAFMNRLINCWAQNNSVYFRNLTDSDVSGGFIWGHTRRFTIRIEGGGANGVENVKGLIASKYEGGIWLDGEGLNQITINNVRFDGNPLLDIGMGINCPQQATAVTVTNNMVWGCGQHGMLFVDPVGLTITANAFWKGNREDNFYDDIRIVGKTFSPNRNVCANNTHTIDESRTNKGFMIREVNEGANPIGNIYSCNGTQGDAGYQNPAISVLVQAVTLGNSGLGTEDSTLNGSLTVAGDVKAGGDLLVGTTIAPEQAGDGQLALGDNCITAHAEGDVVGGGTLDLTLNTTSYFGNPGGVEGDLHVTSVRTLAATQSRRASYKISLIGSTLTAVQAGTNVFGSGGDAPFSITSPSDGKLRFTDVSGAAVTVTMAFDGVKSIA